MMHMTMAVMLLHSVTSLILHHIWVKQRVSFHKDKRVVDNNSLITCKIFNSLISSVCYHADKGILQF